MPTMTDTPDTAVSMSSYLKRRGTIRYGMLTIDIVVADVRKSWNRIDLLITPIAGSGQTWVASTSVTFPNGDQAP